MVNEGVIVLDLCTKLKGSPDSAAGSTLFLGTLGSLRMTVAYLTAKFLTGLHELCSVWGVSITP